MGVNVYNIIKGLYLYKLILKLHAKKQRIPNKSISGLI